MDLEKLEQDIRSLVNDLDEESFIYDLLLAYCFPKATITRLKNGDRNQSKKPGEIIWKKNLCFTDRPEDDLFTCIDALKNDPAIKKHHPRFIIVTDYETFLAIDTKTADSLDIPLAELPKRANFFLPWAGMEKSAITSENPADIKAAEKMGQLYDLLLHNNDIESEETRHALNVFLSRLLFCFFAEDTGIFEVDQFTKLVDSHTVEDGSNVQRLLQRLFKAMNSEDRSDCPDYIQAFPYVNGGLFADDLPLPAFSRKSRKMLIDCGALNWQAINPDIFGSMMQAVTLGEERSNIGMHYTSVINIMKVIEPLFLNELQEQLEKADGNEKKLEKLLDRLYHMRIFDPACGSGNFLIIAYKELCRLEIEIFQQLQELNVEKWSVARSGIRLNQYFGIEIDDFAVETARLSLWLVEHQMNIEFRGVFGDSRPTLPLVESGNIVRGNAAQIDWNEVCPKDRAYRVYVLGNPPYLGARQQNKVQKLDVKTVLGDLKGSNNLDYISCWFVKAAKYIEGSGNEFSFVTTNSLCQGTQVALLWPHLLVSLEIGFAHTSFKWTNSARANAGVICVIIGMRAISKKTKILFCGSAYRPVEHINAYLTNADDIYIRTRSTQLASLPSINYGSFALDDGFFTLTNAEKERILSDSTEAKHFIRRFVGAKELIQGTERYCVWIDDDSFSSAMRVPNLASRIESVKAWRTKSDRIATQKLASRPYRFAEIRQPKGPYLAFPTVSSERREYIPVAFLDQDVIASNQIYVVPGSFPWLFSVVSSRMHMTWVHAVAGRIKNDYRYSSALCYNTFPFPILDESDKRDLEELVFRLLDTRERYPENTLAELYDPDKMPIDLRNAHQEVDIAIERCYRLRPFRNGAERLEYLFKLYEEMVSAE